MSRKRRTRAITPQNDAAPAPRASKPPARRARSRVAVGVIAAVLAVVAAVVLLARRSWSGGSEDALPPAAHVQQSSGIAFEDFVGADACAECHATEYDAWTTSTHGRAGGPPAERVARAFNGEPIRFRDATVTPRVTPAGEYVFVVARDDGRGDTLRVDGVIGGAHMVGGGTQGFVTRYDDGSVRFLPFEWVRQENVWFCNTATRLDEGWLPITANMSLADCGDWPPVRVLGDQPRFANCQGCHGSQIDVAPEPARPYGTRFSSLAINCESCHGPGREHLTLMRSGAVTSADIGMRALATLSKDESLDICFQCHALKDAIRPGHVSGAALEPYYSLKLPLLGDTPVHPDGRIRTFAYQQGHLSSACYLEGSMTCVDCHEPHAQSYRDVNGSPLPGRFDDRQCTSCHASKVERPSAHTWHPPESEGSRCVACHMPYLQEPEVGTALRYARSDHTIPVPRPATDAALGVEVACQLCHRDRTVAALQAQVDQWYGTLKPRHPVVQRLMDGDARGALLDTTAGATPHPMAEYAALARIVENSLTPDMKSLDRALERRLSALAVSQDADLAATALAALHYARGHDSGVRRFLGERLRTLGLSEAVIRDRWAVVLGFLGDRSRERGEHAAAVAAYRKGLEVRPGKPDLLLSMGLAYADAGDFSAADSLYRATLLADPTRTLAYVNLGITRAALGDAGGAAEAYHAAIATNPADPLPHFNLGNLYLRAGRAAEAVAHYRTAIARGPELAPAHFNLARALLSIEDYEGARIALRDGLQLDRANVSARDMLNQLEAALLQR
jgi:tetratricopeptide (TPR) repeat protein